MKKHVLMTMIFFFSNCANKSQKAEFNCMGETTEFALGAAQISGKIEPFLPHSGAKKFESYLAINLSYPPFAKLFEEIQKQFGKLKNRGEAHLTVITPPEFDEVLSPYLSMKEINEIGKKFTIQSSQLEMLCLGRGEVLIGGVRETSFFIVIESGDLIEFRRQVFKAFAAKGGPPGKFDPENFYPHITIGFSLRDLHEFDGVKKGRNACVSKIRFQSQATNQI